MVLIVFGRDINNVLSICFETFSPTSSFVLNQSEKKFQKPTPTNNFFNISKHLILKSECIAKWK